MRNPPIVMRASDARMIRGLLASRAEVSGHDQEHLTQLRAELERALVLDPGEVPTDVITIQTRVRVLDLTSNKRHEFVLVFPGDADVSENRISVLAPLGTALLGYRQGDEVQWLMPGGLRRLRVERVIQPSEGDAVRRVPVAPADFSVDAISG
ncbi:MAG: GreA/GreB family elongation factor [Gammaproteobacteria bacterium]